MSDLTERAGHLRGAPRALRRGQGDGSESDLASRAWRLSGTVCSSSVGGGSSEASMPQSHPAEHASQLCSEEHSRAGSAQPPDTSAGRDTSAARSSEHDAAASPDLGVSAVPLQADFDDDAHEGETCDASSAGSVCSNSSRGEYVASPHVPAARTPLLSQGSRCSSAAHTDAPAVSSGMFHLVASSRASGHLNAAAGAHVATADSESAAVKPLTQQERSASDGSDDAEAAATARAHQGRSASDTPAAVEAAGAAAATSQLVAPCETAPGRTACNSSRDGLPSRGKAVRGFMSAFGWGASAAGARIGAHSEGGAMRASQESAIKVTNSSAGTKPRTTGENQRGASAGDAARRRTDSALCGARDADALVTVGSLAVEAQGGDRKYCVAVKLRGLGGVADGAAALQVAVLGSTGTTEVMDTGIHQERATVEVTATSVGRIAGAMLQHNICNVMQCCTID